MKVNINVCGQDLEIHLEEYGKNNKGTPILFVHGIPTNARLWRHVQKNLENKFHSYAMDMVGYGQSSMPLDDFEHTSYSSTSGKAPRWASQLSHLGAFPVMLLYETCKRPKQIWAWAFLNSKH